MSDLYAVIGEWGYGLDEKAEILGNDVDAIRYADRENADATAAKIPVVYRTFAMRALEEVDLWDWGHRLPDGRITQYVNERSARTMLLDRFELVRRRKGSDAWEVAP